MDNYLDLAYGTIKQGKNGDWLKSDDRIDFNLQVCRQASNKWYYATLLNLKSQMTKGYNYPNDSIAYLFGLCASVCYGCTRLRLQTHIRVYSLYSSFNS